MGVSTAYTLAQAEELLEAWKACELALATGQAQSYKIGNREFTSVDLKDIRSSIQFYSNVVESLRGTNRPKRVKRVVFRD